MWRQKAGEFTAEVPLVASNHPDLRAVSESFGARHECIPVTPATREAAEERLLALLEEERVELVVLARYMQVLGPRLLQRFPHRIINIHHSFLPAFVGTRSYHQAYARNVTAIGATAHYVTAELDQGPIIEQDVARVSHRIPSRTCCARAATWRRWCWPGRWTCTSATACSSTGTRPSCLIEVLAPG